MYLAVHLLVGAIFAAPPSARVDSTGKLLLGFNDDFSETVKVNISSWLKVTVGEAELLSRPMRTRAQRSYTLSIKPESDSSYTVIMDDKLSARFKRSRRIRALNKGDRLKDEDFIELFEGKSPLLTINLFRRGAVRTYRQLLMSLEQSTGNDKHTDNDNRGVSLDRGLPSNNSSTRKAARRHSAQASLGVPSLERELANIPESDDYPRESLLSLFLRIPRSNRTVSEGRQNEYTLKVK